MGNGCTNKAVPTVLLWKYQELCLGDFSTARVEPGTSNRTSPAPDHRNCSVRIAVAQGIPGQE